MLGLQRARRARRRTAGGQLDARPGVGARERRDVDCRRPPERVCNHSRRRRQMLGRDLLRCTRRWNDDAARDADRRSRAEQRRHRDRDRGVSRVRCSPERRHRLLGVERIRPARKPTTVDHARPVAVAGFGTATITVVSRHVLVTRERVAAVAVRCGSAQRCRGTLDVDHRPDEARQPKVSPRPPAVRARFVSCSHEAGSRVSCARNGCRLASR